MKNLRILSGVILVITAFLLSGCYTQLAMQDNPSNNYGYNNNGQNNGNYQTSADSAYGSQYDSLSANQSDSQGYSGSGAINNYYINSSPYWSDWYSYPSLSLGFYWGGYYNPYYWNSYYNSGCYFCYFNPPILYSSYYNNPYYSPYYNPYYYGYYGNYYVPFANRSKGTYRLRNNDGFRGEGNRGMITGGGNTTLVSIPNSRTGSVSSRNSTTSNGTRRSEPYYANNNSRNITPAVPVRVQSAGYTAERNSTSRGTSRPQYRNSRQSSSGTYQSNRGETRTYNNARSQGRSETRQSTSSTRRSYTPPQRTYSPPQRTYSPPRRSYSPPQRSYSPPARTYSAPQRSSSPPARASSGGGRSSSNSGGRRR